MQCIFTCSDTKIGMCMVFDEHYSIMTRQNPFPDQPL
jgi:hypothetical protein